MLLQHETLRTGDPAPSISCCLCLFGSERVLQMLFRGKFPGVLSKCSRLVTLMDDDLQVDRHCRVELVPVALKSTAKRSRVTRNRWYFAVSPVSPLSYTLHCGNGYQTNDTPPQPRSFGRDGMPHRACQLANLAPSKTRYQNFRYDFDTLSRNHLPLEIERYQHGIISLACG